MESLLAHGLIPENFDVLESDHDHILAGIIALAAWVPVVFRALLVFRPCYLPAVMPGLVAVIHVFGRVGNTLR